MYLLGVRKQGQFGELGAYEYDFSHIQRKERKSIFLNNSELRRRFYLFIFLNCPHIVTRSTSSFLLDPNIRVH